MAGMLERLYLRYSSRFAGLRQVPVLGGLAHRISYSLLPPRRDLWFKVTQGLGEGLWLKLLPRTAGEYFHGRVEPGLQQVLVEYLRPGMVFYDLGANLGFFSLIAARLVAPQGRVYAFEADPEAARRLTEHVERNDLRNVRVVERVVWSSTGSVAFERADPSLTPDRGCGRAVATQAPTERTLTLPSTALDDFVHTEPPPDLIKCDVEGAEVEVFRGAQRLLADHRPLVECEVHSDQNGTQVAEIFAGLDYSLQWLPHRHLLATPPGPAGSRQIAPPSALDSTRGLG